MKQLLMGSMLRFPVVLFGAVLGLLSAFVFLAEQKSVFSDIHFIISPASLFPGTLFGIGVSVLFLLLKAMRPIQIVSVLLLCTFCYFLSFQITYFCFFLLGSIDEHLFTPTIRDSLVYPKLIFSSFCACFSGTYIMMRGLKALVGVYSTKMISRTCWIASVIAATLIVLVFQNALVLIFFVVWQAVILFTVVNPLVDLRRDRTTTKTPIN